MTNSRRTEPVLPADLANATVRDIDTALAAIHAKHAAAQSTCQRAMDDLHVLTADRRRNLRRRMSPWVRPDSETLVLGQGAADAGSAAVAGVLEAHSRAAEEVERWASQIAAGNAEFQRRGGWSRFFLVTNVGGHIHRSMRCSTCNKDGAVTEFAWLPELSGQTDAQAVAQHGAILCTACFPDAPTHWTNAHQVAAEARKAALCPGSGTPLNQGLPHRTGYYTGNWGTCPDCGDQVTLTAAWKLRSHKPKNTN